jgi:hypothetical protein
MNQFERMNRAKEESEMAEREWMKRSFIELAKDHKAHCEGCDIALVSLRIALERLKIPLTLDEGMNFC